MAEEKRVTFMTLPNTTAEAPGNGPTNQESKAPLSSSASLLSTNAASTFSGGKQSKSSSTVSASQNKTNQPSIRLEVSLFEPTADSFPEYNFLQLLNGEKKKRKKLKKLNGFRDEHADDPLLLDNNDDDEVARLAKELEEKYGSGSSYAKKGSKRAAADYYDKGAGYDENDSFIDNTEAYDELIPDEIEPNHGGFYINSGPLEFHHLSNYERPEDAARMPKAKKRMLSTSSEDEGEENGSATTNNGEVKQNGQRMTVDSDVEPVREKNGQVEKKQKVAGTVVEEKRKVKVKRKEQEATVVPETTTTTISSTKPAVDAQKTTTVKDMLRLKRDNHRNKQEGGTNASPQAGYNGIRLVITSSSSSSGGSSSDSEVDTESNVSNKRDRNGVSDSMPPMATATTNTITTSTTTVTPNGPCELPENISVELMQNLVIIEQSVRYLNAPGEHILNNGTVLDLLLKIDQLARVDSKSSTFREQIYAYLESKLNCPRTTLMGKVDKLRGQTDDLKAKKLLQKLKKTVESRMAKLLETYDAECRRVAELKNTMNVIGISVEKQSQVQMPRRRFHWTDSSRRLLLDMYAAAKSNFMTCVGGKKNGNMDEYLATFLKQEILPLWPTGWMKYEELVKEIEKRRQLNKKAKAEEQPPVVMNNGNVGGGIAAVTTASAATTTLPMATNSHNNNLNPTSIPSSVVQKNPNAQQQQQQQKASHADGPMQPSIVVGTNKKNSYDYSINNLIAPSSTSAGVTTASNNSSNATAATATVGNKKVSPSDDRPIVLTSAEAAVALKVRSVATLNSMSEKGSGATVINCDEDSGGGGGSMGGTAADSDSDSSCEIVEVYNSNNNNNNNANNSNNNNGLGMVASAATMKKHQVMRNGPAQSQLNSNNDGSGGGSLLKSASHINSNSNAMKGASVSSSNTGPTASSSAAAAAAASIVDTNDIDVNQIMKDLKELQQWESGHFGSNKKSEFMDRKEAIINRNPKLFDQNARMINNHNAQL